MRHRPRALAGGLLAALALSLAACGSSSGLLSSQEAASLNSALDRIHAALKHHECTAAHAHALALKSRVAQLPSSINGTVRSSLEQGVGTVERLVARDCQETPAATQPQTTITTTTTTTPTVATTTTSPPPPPKKKPKPHTTPATTPTQPGTTTGTTPGQGQGTGTGQGNGNGGGTGNSGGQGGGDPTTATTSTTPTNP